MSRSSAVGALALAAALGAGGCQQTAQTVRVERDVRAEQLNELQRELERPPLYGSATPWIPLYQTLVDEFGVEPRRARRELRACRITGPGLELTQRIVDEAHDTDELFERLAAARAESQDPDGTAEGVYARYDYRHLAAPGGPEEEVWLDTARRLERFPVFASALNWEPLYQDLLHLGLSPARSSRHVLQAARLGISKEEVGALIDAYVQEPARIEEELEVRYAVLADTAYDEGGYDFMKPDRVAIKEAPKIGSITGSGRKDAESAPAEAGEPAGDPRLTELAQLEAQLAGPPVSADLAVVGEGLAAVLANSWPKVEQRATDPGWLVAGASAELGEAFVEGVAALASGRDQRYGRVLCLRYESPVAATRALDLLQAQFRSHDDSGQLDTAPGRSLPIAESDYQPVGLSLPGFLVDRRLTLPSLGAGVPSEETTLRTLALISGSFLVLIEELAPEHDHEGTRSQAESVLAALPQ